MDETAAGSIAVLEAGDRHQVIVRVLDLLPHANGPDLLARLDSVHDANIAHAISRIGGGAWNVDRARTATRAFLEGRAAETVGQAGIRQVSSLKSICLVEYMEVVNAHAASNRLRRLSANGQAGDNDVLAGAMNVTALPSGIHRGPVIRAAVLYKGHAWSMPAPARHSDIINSMFDMLGGVIDAQQTDGFLTASGHFLDRVEGLRAARDAGQSFLETPASEELFSENLW